MVAAEMRRNRLARMEIGGSEKFQHITEGNHCFNAGSGANIQAPQVASEPTTLFHCRSVGKPGASM